MHRLGMHGELTPYHQALLAKVMLLWRKGVLGKKGEHPPAFGSDAWHGAPWAT